MPAGPSDDWDDRIAAVWDSARDRDEAAVVGAVEALVAERPDDDAAARFELASARDFAGREAEAEPLYRSALAGDLDADRRSRARIQLGSTLRNLGRPDEALTVLNAPAAGLEDAAVAFRALALADLGRSSEAVAVLLGALADHLPVYGGAVRRYADQLTDSTVRLSGTLGCRDDAEAARVLAHLPRHLELTRAEAGCVRFEVVRDGDRPVWRVEEVFVDEAAFRAHQERVAGSDWGRATAGIERRYVITGMSDDG